MPKKIVLNVRISSDSAGLILQAVRKLDGVYSMALDLDGQMMTICGDVDPVLITKQLRELGKNASIISVDQIDPKAAEEKQVERKTRRSSLEDDPRLDIEDEQDVRNRKSPPASGDEERSSPEWVSVDPNLEVPDAESSMQEMVSENQTRNRWSRLWNVTLANVKAFLGRGKGKLSSHSQVELEDPTSRTMALSQYEGGSLVPKFGEWDEQSRADDFIHTFDKVREEKQTGSAEYRGTATAALRAALHALSAVNRGTTTASPRASPARAASVPPSGEWDRDEEFTDIFQQVKQERKTRVVSPVHTKQNYSTQHKEFNTRKMYKQISSAVNRGTTTTSHRASQARVPLFGLWDQEDNGSYTQHFDNANIGKKPATVPQFGEREEEEKLRDILDRIKQEKKTGGVGSVYTKNRKFQRSRADDFICRTRQEIPTGSTEYRTTKTTSLRTPLQTRFDDFIHFLDKMREEKQIGSAEYEGTKTTSLRTPVKLSAPLPQQQEGPPYSQDNEKSSALGGDDERGVGNWSLMSLGGDDERGVGNWGLPSLRHLDRITHGSEEAQREGLSGSRDKGKSVTLGGDDERRVGNWSLLSLGGDDERGISNWRLPSLSGDNKRRLEGLDSDIHEIKVEGQELKMEEQKQRRPSGSRDKGKLVVAPDGDDERGVGNWRLPSIGHLDRIAHGSEEAQGEDLSSGSRDKEDSVVLGGDDERGVGNWSLLSLGGDDERGIGNWRLPSLSGNDKRRLEGLDSDIHESKVEEGEHKMEAQKQGRPSNSRDKGKLVAAPDGDAERGSSNWRLSSLCGDDKQRLKASSLWSIFHELNIHDSNKAEEKQSSFSSSNQGKSVALGGDDERGVGNWKMSPAGRDSDTENDMNE